MVITTQPWTIVLLSLIPLSGLILRQFQSTHNVSHNLEVPTARKIPRQTQNPSKISLRRGVETDGENQPRLLAYQVTDTNKRTVYPDTKIVQQLARNYWKLSSDDGVHVNITTKVSAKMKIATQSTNTRRIQLNMSV